MKTAAPPGAAFSLNLIRHAGVPIGNHQPKEKTMGMDVYGTAPTDPVGEYFRRNVWGWHPLIDLTEHLCEREGKKDLFDRCKHWHTNDGDGLGAEDAQALATIIETALAGRHVAYYLEIRKENLRKLPNEPCPHCKGTGIRDDEVGKAAGMHEKRIPPDAMDLSIPARMIKLLEERKKHPRAGQTGWCNACDGRGYSAPFDLNYDTSEESAKEWAAFLKHCGGFEIC